MFLSTLSLHSFFISAFIHCFDNPGGLIPTWLINWAAKVCTDEIMLQILFLTAVVVLVVLKKLEISVSKKKKTKHVLNSHDRIDKLFSF